MPSLPPDRAVALGGALLGLGALISVSFWIFTLQGHRDFWTAPGIAGVAIAAVGVVIMAAFGFRAPSGSDFKLSMTQQSGDRSKNLQAGRNIYISEDRQDGS